MVVAFAGTQAGFDYLTDGQLALAGVSNQDTLAQSFAASATALLQAQGNFGFDVVYTGHTRWVDTWLRWQAV